ncbi:hypothetical protein QCA50_010113 [Cerrena zonata]|uniref:Uncharacterized protein n=1 Tax=Cerrena zonata TaxID=2478898 RepID=A0AAW0GBR6_9APHY
MPSYNRTILSPSKSVSHSFDSRLSEPPYPVGVKLGPRECDWKIALKHSPSLMSFHHDPPLLVPVALPWTPYGVPVQWRDLERYARFHRWLDPHVFCFCPGQRVVSVFTVYGKESEHYNNVCVGCASWTSTGGGCSYFVNLERLEAVEKGFHLYDFFPEVDFGKANGKKRAKTHPITRKVGVSTPYARPQKKEPSLFTKHSNKPPAHTLPLPTSQLLTFADEWKYFFPGRDFSPLSQALPLTPPPLEPELAGTLENLTRGYFDDIARIASPPAPDFLYNRIEDLPIPHINDAQEVVTKLLSPCGNGVRFHELMGVLGRCNLCGHIIALPVFHIHICRTNLGATPTTVATTTPVRPSPSSPSSSNSSPCSSSSVRSDQATSSTSRSPSCIQEYHGILYETSLLPICARGGATSSPTFSDVIDLTIDD